MRKRMSFEEFVKKAQGVHGDKYDYSQVNYVNSKTKVKIICPIHGEFEQAPEKHWLGRGCPLCGKEKWKETNIKKYGNPYPLQNQVSKERCKETCLERYGTDNPSKSEEVKEQTKQTNLERYGVEWTCLSEEVIARRQETNKERYGGISPFCSKEVQAKSRQQFLQQHGVTNAMHVQKFRDEVTETKRQNGTFCTSKSEDILYEILVEVFGEDDVKRQYRSEVYPFTCDFYILSRDMYIELNGHWSHTDHWYDESSEEDKKLVQLWKDRGTLYYQHNLRVWTQRDVLKRQMAQEHHLNYVVFWYDTLEDVELWLALNCPDGHDYDVEYSWLLDRR